jgi:hypothetical protein
VRWLSTFRLLVCVCSGKTEEVVVIDDDPDPLTRSGPFSLFSSFACRGSNQSKLRHEVSLRIVSPL